MKATYFAACVFLFSLFDAQANSQILPAENDTLNYRLIGFSVPSTTKAISYKLEIALGRINNQHDFEKNIIYTATEKDNRIIAVVPEFGKEYTWQISSRKRNGKVKGKSPLYHFYTGADVHVDTSKYRVKVLTNNIKDKKLFVFIDYLGALYDLDGRPLWYLPRTVDSLPFETVRDLKLTPQGTLTFLQNAGNINAYEVDYDGSVLWKAPNDGRISNDTSEFYHHEFTRLANGHYLIAGREDFSIEIQNDNKKNSSGRKNERLIFEKNGKFYRQATFPTLIEYDSAGHIAWSWKFSNYFTRNGLMLPLDSIDEQYHSSHLNSFECDETNKVIYLSLRNLNSIWKISYPGGEVIAKYDAPKVSGDILYRAQHSVRLSGDGNLLMYNNNSERHNRNETGSSFVTIIKEPVTANMPYLIWTFPCDIDTLARHQTATGGSVAELTDRSILVSMGSANRHFIVNREKEVLWNAITEMNNGAGQWVPFGSYRNAPVEGVDQIERMIFRTK